MQVILAVDGIRFQDVELSGLALIAHVRQLVRVCGNWIRNVFQNIGYESPILSSVGAINACFEREITA